MLHFQKVSWIFLLVFLMKNLILLSTVVSRGFTDQYTIIVRWFGDDEKTLDKVFYELKNFSQRDLNFMM